MSKKHKRAKHKFIALIIEFVILLILAVVLFLVTKLTKIQTDSLNPDNITINDGLSDETIDTLSDYQTIALFGLDNRANGSLSKGRSDVIMLANINRKTHEIKLVSIYRDTYLDTGNNVYEKCNAAYARGGPERALSMLNSQLDLAITDYVTVDFNAIIECIDLLGGVEMTITDDEASYLIGYIRELNELTGNTSTCPTSGGTYTLDGVQATAFARIRFGGGDDYKRTERQRDVLAAMAAKAKQSDLKTLNRLINQVFGDIQTSFSSTELLALAADIFKYELGDTIGFPFQKISHRYQKEGDVVIPCDLSSNVSQLHEFLFGTTGYTPSDTVQEHSNTIINKTGYRQGDGA